MQNKNPKVLINNLKQITNLLLYMNISILEDYFISYINIVQSFKVST